MHIVQYLNAFSYNPVTHKIATPSSLCHRSESHCSTEFKEAKANTVKQSLTLNSYSNNLINTCRQNESINANRYTSTEAEESVSARYVPVPYIKETSERVYRDSSNRSMSNWGINQRILLSHNYVTLRINEQNQIKTM